MRLETSLSAAVRQAEAELKTAETAMEAVYEEEDRRLVIFNEAGGYPALRRNEPSAELLQAKQHLDDYRPVHDAAALRCDAAEDVFIDTKAKQSIEEVNLLATNETSRTELIGLVQNELPKPKPKNKSDKRNVESISTYLIDGLEGAQISHGIRKFSDAEGYGYSELFARILRAYDEDFTFATLNELGEKLWLEIFLPRCPIRGTCIGGEAGVPADTLLGTPYTVELEREKVESTQEDEEDDWYNRVVAAK